MIQISEFVGRVFTYISIALMLFLSIPIAYEAVMRSFGHPTIWVFETTLYSFIFLGFMGNVLAVKSGTHFRVTLLADLFPRYRRIFDLLAHFSVLLFAVLIIASGSYFAWYSWTHDTVSASLLEIPMWIPQIAIPLGGVGLFLQTLVAISRGGREDLPHIQVD
ncbi:TRAP transporter small permease subunit [Billgrantia diversa]|uniref:TRAP transporter small permease n=1 Tax=Halomonas sp. MCCC 1A13316 TaxID=2733487 RepID=UPI0018A3899D|nr:TRAP transporter small permease subunit [Halomonas sp. MCCC 1A13316]QOR37449.1 TRAP transporter small permease subunit [Halomonas sp. MCCC 1A13316]